MKQIIFLLAFLFAQSSFEQPINWYMAASNQGFVLDNVGVNSVGAYSLRKLRKNYSGPAIRVRRTSDNAQSDIQFTGNGDLNTTSLLSFAGAGSAFVVTMYDQSGNSKNATQASASDQPQIVNSGSLFNINGKPQMYLDATDYLIGSDLMGSSASEIVVFTTIQTYATSNGIYGNVSFALNISPRFWVHLPFNDGNIYFDAGDAVSPNRIVATGQFSNATLYQFTFVNSVSSSYQAIRKNGAVIASDATGHTVATSLVSLSRQGPEGVQGYLSEFIFYESSLSTNSIKVVEKNQGSYFGITIN